MTTFEQFVPPVPQDFEPSDTYKPAENRGKPLIVKVLEHKHIEKTKFKAEGGPGVVCHVLDLATGTKYRRVLWMQGAIVDAFAPYAGKGFLVVSFGSAPTKSGEFEYTTVLPGTPEMLAYAQQYVTQHGDPFPPEVTVPAVAPAAAPAWQAPAQAAPAAAPAAVAPAQAAAAPPPWAAQAAPAPAATRPPWESQG